MCKCKNSKIRTKRFFFQLLKLKYDDVFIAKEKFWKLYLRISFDKDDHDERFP